MWEKEREGGGERGGKELLPFLNCQFQSVGELVGGKVLSYE